MQMFSFVSFNMVKHLQHIVLWLMLYAQFCEHSPFQPNKGQKYDLHL